MVSKSTTVVGIDLGTTNSLIACIRKGNPEIIPNDRGSRMTPSVVSFRDGRVVVGELANGIRQQDFPRMPFTWIFPYRETSWKSS
ncbi:MAG: Hsp70 family protein [Syntrophobacteraceae bacterium]